MEQLDIVLDQKQAKVFARAIYRDVLLTFAPTRRNLNSFYMLLVLQKD